MLFDFWVSSRMELSFEGRRVCLETVRTIAELAEKAGKNGISALEDEMEALDNIFFKTAVRLLVDGMREDEIRKILQNYIITGNFRGRELFRRILIMEGILAIQHGYNSRFIVYELLASYFGEEFLPEYMAAADKLILTGNKKSIL